MEAPAAEVRSLADPSPFELDLFSATPLLSGVAITPATAMRATPVRAAIQAIAETIGYLPCHTYRRTDGDSREKASDHPVSGLLRQAANPWTPASVFKEQVVRDCLLWGNSFSYVNRQDGKPRELIRLAPGTVTAEQDSSTGEPIYRLAQAGGGTRFLDRQSVLHVQAPSLNGLVGESPITACREAIGLCLVLERHAATLFGRGARPSGLLKFPNRLGAETAARIKASWTAAHAGANSGATAVLEEGGAFEALTFSSTDAQFLELRQFQISEIARAFRVPPVFLADFSRATWSNSEEMGRQFLTFTLMPWLTRLEGEFNLKLFSEEERERFFVEFQTDALLRADIGARMEAYSKAISARILSPNEARAAENRAPYDGGDKFENPNTSTGAQADV